jgi:hypothetical protein
VDRAVGAEGIGEPDAGGRGRHQKHRRELRSDAIRLGSVRSESGPEGGSGPSEGSYALVGSDRSGPLWSLWEASETAAEGLWRLLTSS